MAVRHESHQCLGHDDDGSHHVGVLVFEDVAVEHVPPRVAVEAAGNEHVLGRDDGVVRAALTGVDAEGVLPARLVGVDRARVLG